MTGSGLVSDNGFVTTEPDEAGLVARAVDGDKAAPEEVIRLLSDPSTGWRCG